MVCNHQGIKLKMLRINNGLKFVLGDISEFCSV